MFRQTVFVLITLCVFILTGVNVFAQDSANFSVDKNQVSTGEDFVLTIDVQTSATGVLEIEGIDGIEDFVNVGKSTSNQVSIINGESSNKSILNLSMRSSKTGDFVIGPVKIKMGEKLIETNTLNIKVVAGNNQGQTNKIGNLTPINNSADTNNGTIKQNQDSNTLKGDIKTIKSGNNMFYEFMFYQVLIILLLVGLYYYNSKIAQKNRLEKEKEISDVMVYDSKKNDLVERIKKMFKSVEVLSKTDFYQKLNKVFREYFDLLGFENTDMMTLKEIKELDIDQELMELFERSYYYEFSNQKETYKSREDLINDLLRIITK